MTPYGLLLNHILFFGVDYTSLLICAILTANLYVMLIFAVSIILNLLAILALRIALLVTLHYCVLVIYVCLMTEIVFDAGLKGQFTYV